MGLEATKKPTLSEPTQIALSYLLTKQTFFSHLLYDQMELSEGTEAPDGVGGMHKIDRAATDGKRLIVNPEWFAKMRPPERAFVLAHEIMHAMFLHAPRAKLYAQLNRGPDGLPFDHERWNDACDYVINASLKKGKVGEPPADGMYDDAYDGNEMVDQVYRDLPPSPSSQKQQQPQDPGDEDSGDGDGDGDGQGEGEGQGDQPNQGNGFDQHLEAESLSSKGDEANMERAIKQAAAAAKAQGNLPGNLQELIDDLVEPQVPWREMLRTEMQINSNADENNWNRPNRRRLVADIPIILPTQSGVTSGELMIEIDTSGSVSAAEVASYLSEIKAICSETLPEMVTILWVDAAVQKVDYVEFPEEFDDVLARIEEEGIPGRGGTDMCAAFEWAKDNNLEPHHCIVFTDMYTPFPNEEDVDYPVTWCSTTKGQKAPFGQTIFVDPNSHDAE